ncbi:MAG: histidine kinase [Ignavibacteriaceae bacterium]|nr:histidine kinase [Ignavibacteriaceae bacterium]
MQKSPFKILIVLFLFALCEVLTAQYRSFSFERFTIEDGLSNNSINCILQTSDGFLWIATKDGLNRFDGQSFVIFKHDPTSENSLPENYIMSLFESHDKTFWVGTWGSGLCKYDPIHESFIKIETNLVNDNYVQCIDEDKSGSLWFGTFTGGLFKYNPYSKQTLSFNINPGSSPKLINNNITTLVVNEDNSLWIGTWGSGFSFFDEQKNIVKHFTHNVDKNSLSNNNVWFLQKDEHGKILVCSDFGIDLYDPNTDSFTHNINIENKFQQILNTPIRQSYRDSYNRLWIGTYEYHGLLMIEKDRFGEAQIHHLVKETDNPQSLTMNRIRWIYEDRKKNIWVGTEDGLNKLPATKPFIQFRFFPLRKISLGGGVISGIVEGRDSILWVGFAGAGFDKIDLRKNSIQHFKNDVNNPNSLNENDVTAIFEDHLGKIWIGTTHSGLNRFDPLIHTFKHFTIDAKNPESSNLNWIQQILETKNGTLLIGTNAGLEVFDRSSQKFSVFNPQVKGKNTFPKIFSTNALFEDRYENLWIGTWLDGLFLYDKKSQKFFQYLPDSKNSKSISSNKITCITEDSQGFIWIGTHSGGINKFDRSTGKFYRYSTKHGLPNDVVFGILEDAKGFLWISTLNGLAKFDPRKEKFRNYDVADGIIHNQFNWHASFINKLGQMYFGTINGLISFHPDSVKIDPVPPSVALTSFKVFGKEAALPQSLPATKEISLNYDQNFFSIDFTALDIAPSHKHQFAYLLEGIDPDWVLSEQRSIAFYTDINPGKYKFFIKACNADGVWSLPISLSIIISPAWWMTWWFKIIVGLSFLTLGYLAYLYRLRQLLAIQNIRLNIANDLHDEIGSNLSSISVDSQMLLRSSSLDETEQELASFISKTAKETVETMRDIIWFINPKNDFDTDMIIKMRETAAKLLVGVSWTFQVPSEVKLEKFNLEVRRNIFLIYKEVLHNIVRHANSQTCFIELGGAANSIYLIIKDEGVGFDERTVHENNGLRSIKRRAGKINAEIKITSEIGKGTVINLSVPFGIHK